MAIISYLEIRSLVDFQIGNGPHSVLRVRFRFGNSRLVAFQIGNEPSLAHGDHFGAAGIRFLSTQRIGGGDLEGNGHFP